MGNILQALLLYSKNLREIDTQQSSMPTNAVNDSNACFVFLNSLYKLTRAVPLKGSNIVVYGSEDSITMPCYTLSTFTMLYRIL